MLCNECFSYYHFECTKISKKKLREFQSNVSQFVCTFCKKKSNCYKCKKICSGRQQSVKCICCDHRYCLDCLSLPAEKINAYFTKNEEFLCYECQIVYPCRVCNLPCENFPDKEGSIFCDSCSKWEHISCSKIKLSQFNRLGKSSDAYYCSSCISDTLPFSRVAKMESESSTLSRNRKKILHPTESCSLCIECNDECDVCDKSCPDLYRVCDSCLKCDYLESAELNSILKKRNVKQLAFLHLNASSLVLEKNYDNICNLVNSFENKPEIICISETRMNTKTNVNNFKLSGYGPPIFNVSTTQAGGTCIYVREECTYKPRNDLDFNIPGEAEVSFIEIEASTKVCKNTIIGCVYRHPHENHDIFSDNLINSVEKVNKNCNVILMGDFNVDILCHNNDHTKQYKNMLLSLGLRNTINKATRITPTCESSLDHLHTNINLSKVKSGILQSDISDHFPIYGIVANMDMAKKHACTQYTRRFFSVSKIPNLIEAVQSNLIDVIFDDNVHPNVKLERLVGVLQKSIDKIFPHTQLSRKKQKQFKNPWVTPLIVNSTQKCKTLFRTYLKKKDVPSHEKYKSYRNILNRLIENAKDMHDENEFKKVDNDIKKTWKLINEKAGRSSKNNTFPKVLKSSDGNLICNPTAIANSLNKHFVQKATDLANKIENTDIEFSSFLTPRISVNFHFKKFIVSEVLRIINSLCTSKSTGHDGIPACILKWCANIIAPILTDIFNEFVEIGEYPSICKIAKITPLTKPGDPTNKDNYRGISVLTQLNKIFEKLIHGRMVDFIDDNDILCKTQFGFRKGLSTSDAITHLNEKLIENIEKKKVTAVLFMDLKSAFDTVNHEILLKKLEHIGFRGSILCLLSSYLTGRQQYIKSGSIESVLLDVVCGVPQGSVLGPLLFILYINDIVNCSGLESVLYADDAALVASADTIKKNYKELLIPNCKKFIHGCQQIN